jgi:predicted ATPase/DNA-binding winged helix-turn-helix (wHTH) protein
MPELRFRGTRRNAMPDSYRFGRFEVRPVERLLLADESPVALGSRAFDVLVALVANRDRVVTKRELLDAAWPGLVVEENSLQAQVSALRKVLGPAIVATIPGLGYRFAMPVNDAPPAQAPIGVGPPPRLETLVGREHDVNTVIALVQRERLVTIAGAGGIGKTRLAEEAGRRIAAAGREVAWVDLGHLKASHPIAPAIAIALGVRLGQGDALPQLARAVSTRAPLVILDNAEHVSTPLAPVIRVLLRASSGLGLLVTSQEILRLPAECVHALEPLGPAEAEQLLVRRVSAVDPRFSVVPAEAALANDLCRRLDGMPLAIEMAAARVSTLGLGAVVARLGERLDLLRSADRTAPSRQQTLRATLEWSHASLTAEEQAIFRRLSTFVSAFRLSCAQRVASESDRAEWEIAEGLAGLVDKSLLNVDSLQPPRYRLLETMRLFAQERLREHGEEPAALAGHGRAMAELCREIMADFDARREVECLGRYMPDYDDLEAAFERACERSDPEIAGACAEALSRLDFARGSFFPMRRRKSAALTLARSGSALARARLWYCVALLRFIPCPGISKIDAAREEVACRRQCADEMRLYEALVNLASNLGTAGHDDEAEAVLAEARSLERPYWPLQVRGIGALWATTVAAYSGDLQRFAARIDEQERLAASASFDRLRILSRMQRAELALASGACSRALALGTEAIAAYRAFGSPFGVANCLATYCDSLLLSGRHEEVPEPLLEAILTALPNGVACWSFDSLAVYAATAGRLEEAALALGFADAQYRSIEEIRRPWDRQVERRALEMLAALPAELLAARRTEGARLTDHEAEALARDLLASGIQHISARAAGGGVQRADHNTGVTP